MKKYYLISYGFHYRNPFGETAHLTCVTDKPPIEFINSQIQYGKSMEPACVSYHITFATEITEEEFKKFNDQ